MTERTKQHPLDVQEEEVLQGLFDDAMEWKGHACSDTSEAEKEVIPQIPEELDAKCRQLIHESGGNHKRIQFLKNTKSGLRKVAIIALALLAVISFATVSVDAIRIPVLNFLSAKDGRYSKIPFYKSLEKGNNAPLNEKILSVPLPEGYVLTDEWEHDGVLGVEFDNEESLTICVSFYPSGKIINYDVEDAEQIQIKVLNHDAVFIIKQGLRVMWMSEEYNGVFDVKANGLSEEVFWKYVLSLAEL